MELSVVTAVYNGENFIKDSIKSILKQTQPNFEYMIVNDGSTDETKNILNSISDSRIKIIHLEQNQGAAKCLKQAVEMSEGSLIAIQDADDISYPERLEKQAAFLKNNLEYGLTGSYIECIYQEKRLQKRAQFTERLINNNRSQDFYGSSFCHGTFMFRKELYKKIGGYSSRYEIAYDYDLLLRFASGGKVHKIPEKLYGYRLHSSSLSSLDIQKTNDESMEVSIRGIIECAKQEHKLQNYLIVGTDKARQYFKQKIEPKLQHQFSYAAPILSESLHNSTIIILDYYGSFTFTKELDKKGLRYYKVWCAVH
ncbi:glycosyltransferase family 2 protein [Bacillus sp. USDA818B3_A]|uniref:glycosyltransferase family 2 protein n=1 Tax=Bacillus sp. USDA818B3_A TaxID=2698834 RepID=UPI001369E966|nr:glycosyltransferase [Bacillus sp. USDA818B3_A]